MVYRLVLLLSLLGIGYGQGWQVERIDKVTDAGNGMYFYPQFSSDGNKLYFTTSKYHGLYAFDLNTRFQKCLTESEGAGYLPVYGKNDKKIYYNKVSYLNRKRQSTLIELDVETMAEHEINTDSDQAISLRLMNDQTLVFQTQGEFKAVELSSYQIIKMSSQDHIMVYSGNQTLSSARGNATTNISPMGKVHYIWVSLSPDQKKILFTVAGKGTYVSDLDGNILHELGYAHAPKWSPDGQWILYMDDRDDGHQYTSSELFISRMDGSTRFQLTDSDLIAMYPNWALDGKRITFHSDKGEIYLLELSYERSTE